MIFSSTRLHGLIYLFTSVYQVPRIRLGLCSVNVCYRENEFLSGNSQVLQTQHVRKPKPLAFSKAYKMSKIVPGR